ncbi:MAG: RagB/SusD family nutrient uptake outer membrane protein, partial [Flavobacteriales bacterium]|nr:RagB/SusD family nutrient uptake outer membrane protein [Flavobacteriales bacterium]
MKRIIIPILEITFFCLLLIFTGCKKFLDIDPPYSQDAENFFTNESDYERALIGAYDLLQGTFLSVWISEIASDNTIAGGESVTDTEGLHQIDAMTHGAVNNELRNIFRWNYAGITRCNFITENKDKIDFDGKEKIIGQARFLRAYYYFELVKFFGDVPLIIDERLGVEEVTTLPRSPKSEVYSQIEADLLYAIGVLDLTSLIKGEASKGAAQSLLGKVYLYQEKWTEAAQMFDGVISSGQYGLFNDYATLFLVDNEGCNETIFDVEYSGLEGGSYGCLICLEGNAGPGFQGIRQYNGPVYGDGNSYNLPTQNLYDAFQANDLRRDATCLDIDAFIAAQPNAGLITYAEGGGGHTG